MCVQKDTVSDLKLVFLFVFTLKSVLFLTAQSGSVSLSFRSADKLYTATVDQLMIFRLSQLIS